MDVQIPIQLDRAAGPALTDQISAAIRAAILDGRLASGARLPSWRDLAAQLGVARGTVRVAYENLRDQQFIVAAGAAGTRVAARAVPPPAPAKGASEAPSLAAWPARPDIFQMGVPAQDVFPFKTWARILGRAARQAAARPMGYADPRGEPALRTEIAAHLGIARGIVCAPAQVFVTNGYVGALGVALRALRLNGSRAWMEEPGFIWTRKLLAQSGVTPVPVPVDKEGIDVAAGVALAPDARLAVVTAGQQAPLGVTLSLRRRLALLEWAAACDAWIIEDDYLGELQLRNRAAPALASLDRSGRVLHLGSFSKTLSPALRVGFMVVPPDLVMQVTDAVTLAMAPAALTQLAIAEFMREGHYLRHLRRMKRVYGERLRALVACLDEISCVHAEAGLAVLLRLPQGYDDAQVALQARPLGLMPSALSWWYAEARPECQGLLLGVTNLPDQGLADCCARLASIWTR